MEIKKWKERSQRIGVFCLQAGLCLFLIYFFQKILAAEFEKAKEKFAASPWASGWVIDEQRVAMKARIKTLNRQMPDFEYFVKVAQDHSLFREALFDPYLRYYERVVEYMPGIPEAWGILGFAHHFYPGQAQAAIKAYERALSLNPRFFWFYHNLGILYFRQGDYAKAAASFERAIQEDFSLSSQFIASSRYIYRQILSSYYRFFQQSLEAQFKKGYRNSLIMLLQSYGSLEKHESVLGVGLRALQSEGIKKEVVYFYMGKAAFNLKQYDRSVIFLKACLKDNPHNTDAFQYLALSLKALGHDQAALDTLKQMVFLLKTGNEKVSQFQSINLEMY